MLNEDSKKVTKKKWNYFNSYFRSVFSNTKIDMWGKCDNKGKRLELQISENTIGEYPIVKFTKLHSEVFK